MNKTIVVVVGIIAISSLSGLYIWTSHNRYYIATGADGFAYEVDKKTGQSWMLRGWRKTLQTDAVESKQEEQELPSAQASKITGNASLEYGRFSGKLYNGSDWVVTKVVIGVAAIEKDGTTRWSRDFSATVTITPLSTESFSILVSGEEGIRDAPWTIKKAFGHQE